MYLGALGILVLMCGVLIYARETEDESDFFPGLSDTKAQVCREISHFNKEHQVRNQHIEL